MDLNHLKKRLRETLNGFISDVDYAGDFEEIFDILEDIIDQASMYLDDVDEAMSGEVESDN